MSIQTVAAVLTLLAILALGAVFLRVRWLAHDGRDYAPVQGTAYRIRTIVFWVLVLVGLPISILLFRENPYSAQAAAPQVVNATGYQWYWDLDRSEVTAGTPVEFRVTSADVNHGFGIYDAGGTLVAQTQAMPGYVNRLIHVFDAPGTYDVLCLEYCGLVHHNMIAEIVVNEGEANDD
jgi:cytochrome c oxidase subunit 2